MAANKSVLVSLLWAMLSLLFKVLRAACRPLARQLRAVVDLLANIAFGAFFWMSGSGTMALSPVFEPTLLLSATEIAERIRTRKMTCFSVVKKFLSRISDVNPGLNAMAEDCYFAALQGAKDVDLRLAHGFAEGTLTVEGLEKSQPLLGVPFILKESISSQGMLHTCGLISRGHTVATRDADAVSALKEAGAILLCTTNVAELSRWWETENRLYGITRNPYDTCRGSGGAGEAALLSACGAPLALGADIGGSIRTPAFFCGVFGHKPSAGLISPRGSGLFPSPDPNPLMEVGPMSRHARDLKLLLKVLYGAGPEEGPQEGPQEGAQDGPQGPSRGGRNALTGPPKPQLSLNTSIDLFHIKVFSATEGPVGMLTSELHPELRQVQKSLEVFFLETHDIRVQEVQFPLLAKSWKIWRTKMEEVYSGFPKLRSQMGNGKTPPDPVTELLRASLGRANYTWPTLLQTLLEGSLAGWQRLGEEQEEEGRDLCQELRTEILRTLGQDGVLLYPSHPTLAPHHRQPLLAPLNFTYAAVFNALGLPVTQVPLGLSSTGLPLGIQVVGGASCDHLTLAVAEALERGYGGWRCPAEIL